MAPSARTPSTVTSRIPTRGPFSLEELAVFGFGHRSEAGFDGVMRLAFCVDGDLERHAAVAVRQEGDELLLEIEADADLHAAVEAQVARVLSCDHDGDAFVALGGRDPVIGRLQAAAPGLRPPMFFSPYEAAVWSIISARRPRAQGIRLRESLNAAHGASFEVAGVATSALPTPAALRDVVAVPGLPADRIPRLHAVAEAAMTGSLGIDHLNALDPDTAMLELQRLPGIGPFYSALIVVRACGLADVLPIAEQGARDLVRTLYELDGPLDDAAYIALAERWRPFRTWAVVLIRAASKRILPASAMPVRERPQGRGRRA